MRATAPGESVLDLPWLCPGADALAALARAPVAWPALRDDPGAVLLVARHCSAFASPTIPFTPSHLLEPSLIEAALRGIREHGRLGFTDWTNPATREVRAAALAIGRQAERVARATGRGEPVHAWVAGLLAPLGSLALCATGLEPAGNGVANSHFVRHPVAAQRRCRGLDQGAVARRLARRWGLPPWLAALVGHLGLPADDVRRCGGSPELTAIVGLAVHLAQQVDQGLCLAVGPTPQQAAVALGLAPQMLEELTRQARQEPSPVPTPSASRPPSEVPLLADLLTLALENRRLRDEPGLLRLEAETDALADALQEARSGEAERLRALKLTSLAELAAGAGHEINNPLAVISGQAQVLLSKLRGLSLVPCPLSLVPGIAGPAEASVTDPGGSAPEKGQGTRDRGQGTKDEWESALRKIVEQAQRIHLILRDLMQFARPPQPQKQLLDAGDLVQEVVTSLADLAVQRRVRMVVPPPPQPVPLCADRAQVRTALTCLLRNAVEAAPADGWAGVRLDTSLPSAVEIVIEDNGPGPPPQQREHLFDPFYSGRAAGRGRGLGLPTAWRFAQQHGGDVRYVSLPDGLTRFILTLPRELPAISSQNGNGHA